MMDGRHRGSEVLLHIADRCSCGIKSYSINSLKLFRIKRPEIEKVLGGDDFIIELERLEENDP